MNSPHRDPAAWVVDDSSLSRKLAETHLRRAGASVTTFGLGVEAFRALRGPSALSHPALLIVDHDLTDSSGEHVGRAARLTGYSGVLILWTGTVPEHIGGLLAGGFDAVVCKSVTTPRTFVALWGAALRRAQQRAA